MCCWLFFFFFHFIPFYFHFLSFSFIFYHVLSFSFLFFFSFSVSFFFFLDLVLHFFFLFLLHFLSFYFKPFLSGLRSNKCLSDSPCVVAWRVVTSVSWRGNGWTPSRDSRSWQQGGIRGCRVDWILGRPKFSIYCTSSTSMRSITPTSSPSVGISPVPQSPLQASPMNVESALGVPIFERFPERIRVHPQSWTRQLLHYGR